MNRILQILAGAALALTGACDSGTYYYDPYAYDSYYYYGYDSAYYYSYYDPYYYSYYIAGAQKAAAPSATPEDLATQTATAAPTYYSPATCVNATSAGATATIALTNCATGPLGLRNISGTLTATFSVGADGISVATSATNLVIDGKTATFNGSATSTSTATGRSLTATSNGQFTSSLGKQFTRMSQVRVDWVPGSGCATLNGNGTITGNGQSFASTLTNLQKCKDACPTAGTLALTAPNREVTVTFDGTAHPPISASDTSNTGSLDLTCTPKQ
jgi:hypothetical protein